MKKGLIKFWKNLKIIYSNFTEDQAFLRATGLSYITFLAFMPFIMVIFLFTPNITVIRIKDVFLNFILPPSYLNLQRCSRKSLMRCLHEEQGLM